MPAQTVIKVRRDTAANWASTNPVLAAGEHGFETNTGKFKIGDGTTAYISLDYATDWANITEKPTSFTPSAHAASHASGGSDAISIANTQVSGLGTASTKDVAATGNASSTQVVLGDDTRLTNSRTPTAHKNSHEEGGADQITVTSAMIANNTIVNDDISTNAAIASSKISVAAPAATDAAKAVGYIGMPQNILASGGLTLSAAHAGDHIYVTGTGQTITIPPNSGAGSVAFEIGTTIVIINAASVTTSIAITSDTLLLAGTATQPGGSRTLGPHGMATLVKITSTSWIISGNGLT